jgi:hypothetical protein
VDGLGHRSAAVHDPKGTGRHTDGFIGYTFFERSVVCVDFPRNRLFIARWQAGNAADVRVVDYH